jgi:hypothetical protein
MMPVDELQLGRLIQKVETLGTSIETMRAENSADHENVTRRLDALDEKLDRKAPMDRVEDQHGRIDSLERERDERKGKLIVIATILTVVVGPAIVGLFLIAAGVIA